MIRRRVRTMAYDPELEARLDEILAGHAGLGRKKMFGGLAYMVEGHMCVGIIRDLLMARVGPEAYESCLRRDHVRPMDFTGRPLKGFVYVLPEGIATQAALLGWVERCLAFVQTLEPKR